MATLIISVSYSLQYTYGRRHGHLHAAELRETGELQSDDVVPGTGENTLVGRRPRTRTETGVDGTRDRNHSQGKQLPPLMQRELPLIT